VVLDDDPGEEPIVIHAMPLRPKFFPYPRWIRMPRTREQLQQALADTEAWFDQLNPRTCASSGSDASDLHAIGDALRAVAASDLSLADQVAKARANGRTWTQIAAVLGVSKQAARERFGEPAHR
jgi:hypothetical protein